MHSDSIKNSPCCCPFLEFCDHRTCCCSHCHWIPVVGWRMLHDLVNCLLVVLVVVLCFSLDLAASISDEGRALLRFKQEVESDPYGSMLDWDEEEALAPCCWSGIQCEDGRVVELNLKDLGLRGKLALDLGKLINLKVLNLHNNSFFGAIPQEISKLHNLEVLDLGHNNLSGPLPSGLERILSLKIFILGGNGVIGVMSQKLQELDFLSELQFQEDQLSKQRRILARSNRIPTIRRLLQVGNQGEVKRKKQRNGKTPTQPFGSPAPAPQLNRRLKKISQIRTKTFVPPSLSPSSKKSSKMVPTHAPVPTPSQAPSAPPHASPFLLRHFPAPVRPPSAITESPSQISNHKNNSDNEIPPTSDISLNAHGNTIATNTIEKVKHARWAIYMSIAASVSFLIAVILLYTLCWRANKVVTIKPWATGLSGQLQKAFVTGVPSLKRSELQAACEDFSNIIGSLSQLTIYKGTLSSGVEIAVVSSMVKSAKDWSKESESQFRKKVTMLSKVNHKNFLNLLGYCEKEEPFTRMMVFEYAPNGTLYEHLHVKESEHLDWPTRLRIAMGIAYCLDHMLQLEPPVILKNLNSSSVYLTEDYAAKLSDIEIHSEHIESKPSSGSSGSLEVLPDKERTVARFGTLLLEIISGKVPLSEEDGLANWAAYYTNNERALKDLIDPSLESFNQEVAGALCKVIWSCIYSKPERPTMAQVANQLRDITSMSPDGATPKVSPLWWAELEIVSAEGN